MLAVTGSMQVYIKPDHGKAFRKILNLKHGYPLQPGIDKDGNINDR